MHTNLLYIDNFWYTIVKLTDRFNATWYLPKSHDVGLTMQPQAQCLPATYLTINASLNKWLNKHVRMVNQGRVLQVILDYQSINLDSFIHRDFTQFI